MEDKTFNVVLTNETIDRTDPSIVSVHRPIVPSSLPPEVDPQEVLGPPHPPVVGLPPRPALEPPAGAVTPLPASPGSLATSDPGGARGELRHKPVRGPVIKGVNDSAFSQYSEIEKARSPSFPGALVLHTVLASLQDFFSAKWR